MVKIIVLVCFFGIVYYAISLSFCFICVVLFFEGIMSDKMSLLECQSLFESQVSRLGEPHYLLLLWSARSEGQSRKYNLTNFFDDLKHLGITRTKQTAVAVIEAMASLCSIDSRDEGNRKNIYISKYGAKALARLLEERRYESKSSAHLEV